MTKDRTKRLWKLMAAIFISLAAVFFLRGPEANAQIINTEGNYENPGDWYWDYTNGERFDHGYARVVNRKTKKTLGKGWHAVDGIWYYFEAGGYIFDEYHGGYAIGGPESGWYQIDDEAPPTYHWEKVTGGWKYVKDTYHEYWDPYLHDESARIDGKIYWFDKNGVTYKPGWQLTEWGEWIYVNNDRSVKTGWQKIGAKWYFFDLYTGIMATSGKDTSPIGSARKDFYGFYENGTWITKAGWVATDGYWDWVYVGKNGKLLTGWQKIGGKYYYLDPYNGGVMAFSYYAEEEQPEYCYVDGYFINDKGVRCQNGYGWHSDANGFWFGKGSYYEKDCMTYINGGWAEFDEYGYCMRYYDVRTDTLWDFTEAVG